MKVRKISHSSDLILQVMEERGYCDYFFSCDVEKKSFQNPASVVLKSFTELDQEK